jgi:hypothetical protein
LIISLDGFVRDEGWNRTTTTPGWLLHTLETTDWPGLKIVREDLVGFVRELKRADGPELRTLGSLSRSGNYSRLDWWTASNSWSALWFS